MPQKILLSITANLYKKTAQIPANFEMLMKRARVACDNAYAPYSEFFVGAALLLDNGEIVIGTNQENAAYPSGLCAERTAIYWTGANYKGVKINMIAVSARHGNAQQFLGVSPCGSCRQALLEYENIQQTPIKVLLEHEEGILVFDQVADLLPLQFSKSNLEKK
jgi:cytidine deaminase